MSRFRLITFDVTNTILKFRLPVGEQYAQIGSKYGITADPSQLSSSFKTQWVRLSVEHPNFGANTGISWEQWWGEIVHATFNGAGVSIDKNVSRRLTSELISAYSTSNCWDYCEGAKELLKRLCEKRVPVGAVSNFDGRLETILINMDIRDYFKFVISSYDVGLQKPDPRIFELALKLSGCNLRPSEAVHIGDSYATDYVGAIQAGWNAYIVHVKSDKLLQKVKPDAIVESLAELHCHLF